MSHGDSEMVAYPILCKPGDKIPNYSMVSPGKNYLKTNKDTDVTVVNLENVERILFQNANSG
jgi:hypothetical protein